ncbi:MAG: helix-hairpin-helix domain-containing protein [bacterium]|nr:helix-hairpin-helix domain-containing protein [bacterium]
MAKPKHDLENMLGGNVGWVLVMLLVAGSSFLLGSSVNNKTGSQATAVESDAPIQSVISDISTVLQNPAPTAPAVVSNTTPTATPATGIVNINTAGASELDTLPGIGPAYASAIINYRTANGPFVRIDDIVKIKGIGPKTFEKLKSRITI